MWKEGGGMHLAEEGGDAVDDEKFRQDYTENLKRIKQVEDSLVELRR